MLSGILKKKKTGKPNFNPFAQKLGAYFLEIHFLNFLQYF